MNLYIGLAGPLLQYVYVPILIVGMLVLYVKLKHWKTRLWAMPLCLILAYAIPLGDVTWHSWNMSKVCPKAGLHVYRTVVVDGFQGKYGGVETMEKYPYVFVESTPYPDENSVNRFVHSGDQIVFTKIPKPTAEWEIAQDRLDYPDKLLGVTVERDVIRNRNTGEVIAEQLAYSAWRGWIDAKIASVIDNSAGNCYTHPKMNQKFHEILIPSGTTK